MQKYLFIWTYALWISCIWLAIQRWIQGLVTGYIVSYVLQGLFSDEIAHKIFSSFSPVKFDTLLN